MDDHSETLAHQCTTRIDCLSLSNYRQFGNLKVDFHPKLTVLVSPNGGGKTALLDAIAVALRYFVTNMRGENAGSGGFERTGIRFVVAPF